MPRVSGAGGGSPTDPSSSAAAAASTVRPRGVVRRRRKAAAAARAGRSSLVTASASTGEEGEASSSSSTRNHSSSTRAGDDGRAADERGARGGGGGSGTEADELRFDDSSSSSDDDLSSILNEGSKTPNILRASDESSSPPDDTARAAIDSIDDIPSDDLDDEDEDEDEEVARFEELRRRRREAAMAAKKKRRTALLEESSSSSSSGSDDDEVVVTANDGGVGGNGDRVKGRGPIPTTSTRTPKRGESSIGGAEAVDKPTHRMGSALKSPKHHSHHGNEETCGSGDGPTIGGEAMRAVCTGGDATRKKRVSFHRDVKKASPRGGSIARPFAKRSAGGKNAQTKSKSKTTMSGDRRQSRSLPKTGNTPGGRVGTMAEKKNQQQQSQKKKTVVRRSVVTPTPTKAARRPPRQPTVSSSSSSSSARREQQKRDGRGGTAPTHPPPSREERGRMTDDSDVSNPRGEVHIGRDGSPSTSTPNPALPNNRALAVDTRVLRRYPHESAGRVFLDQTLRFLRSAARRGALPRILATPVASMGERTGEVDPSHPSGRVYGGGKNGGTNRPQQKQQQKQPQQPQRKRVTIEARATTLPTDILTGWGGCGEEDEREGEGNSKDFGGGGEDAAWRGLLVPVHVRVLGGATGLPQQGDGTHGQQRVPKSLLAHDSWRLFADLVDVMTVEASKSHGQVAVSNDETSDRPGSHVRLNEPKCPLDVTILTNDVGLFTDTNADSHRRALGRFWERVRVAFDAGKVRSVSIVVVETGVMHVIDPMVGGGGVGGPSPSMIPLRGGCDVDDTSPPVALDPSVVVEGAKENDIQRSNTDTRRPTEDDGQNPKLDASSMDEIIDGLSPQPGTTRRGGGEAPQICVARSLRALRAQLSSLHELDYVRNTGSVGGVGGADDGTSCSCPIAIDLDVMECNTIAFGRMLRTWLRHMVGAASRISFQLPETMDGTVCSIDLDLEYTLLPYPASSPAAAELVRDARSLSTATFEVVQVVPNSKVDASLIYGIAMSAKAGLESDLFRHQEMKSLVRQLWKWLARNDSSLVLRASSTYDEGCIGHHEYFLLMSEELVNETPSSSTPEQESDRRGCAPCNGTLLRYAAEEQILKDGVEDDTGGMASNVQETESDHQYYEYIERSLEYLDRESVNPMLLGCTSGISLDGHKHNCGDEDSAANQTETSDSNVGDTSTSDFDRWTEESGVGSAMGSPTCDEDVDCEDDEDAEGSFVYS